MTGLTLSLNTKTDVAADFRAWGLAVSSAFTTLGFTKTADTGQIDWATVAAPGAANTFQGYEIRQFTDSLQATRPIYMRIRYGSGGTAATPNMQLQVGTGTDGAGNLTSMAGGYGTTVSTAISLGSTSVSDTVTSSGLTTNCYMANADGSAIGGVYWPSVGSSWGGFMFAVERFRNVDGTPNNEGFCWFKSHSAAAASAIVTWQQFVMISGYVQQAAITANTLTLMAAQPSGTTQTIGTTMYPAPIFTGSTPKLQAPSQLLVALRAGELAAHAQFQMSHYGSLRTFVSPGGGASAVNSWGPWSTPNSLANGYAMRID